MCSEQPLIQRHLERFKHGFRLSRVNLWRTLTSCTGEGQPRWRPLLLTHDIERAAIEGKTAPSGTEFPQACKTGGFFVQKIGL